MPAALPLSDLAAAVAAVCVLLATLTVPGVILINTGFGRSRSAAHALLASLLAFGVAALVFVILGCAISGYPGGPHLAHGRLFLRGVKFDGSMNAAALAACLQLIGVGLAAVIPVGTGADRWRLTAVAWSSALLALVTFPLMSHWLWGSGWLARAGALDAGGVAVIQATGGLTALAITWLLGPRQGKYESHGMAIPGHNIAMVIFGCGMAATGFLGLGSAGAIVFAGAAPSALPLVAINLFASASAAVVTALFITRARYHKPDASICANAWVGGLVAISGAASLVPPAAAVAIGFVAGLLIPFSVEWLDRLGYDDPSGAVSVHGSAGLWGVVAVGIFVARPGQWLAQLAVVTALLGFVLPAAYLLNLALNRLHPLRTSQDGERIGLDMHELGAGAYPELSSAIKDQYR